MPFIQPAPPIETASFATAEASLPTESLPMGSAEQGPATLQPSDQSSTQFSVGSPTGAAHSTARTAPGPTAQAPLTTEFSVAPVMVGLPTAYTNTANQLIVQPRVQMGAPVPSYSAEMDLRMLQMQRPSADLTGEAPVFFVQEPVLPRPDDSPNTEPMAAPMAKPLFEDMISSAPPIASAPLNSPSHRWLDHPWFNTWFNPCPGEGLGQERLPFALVDIDSAQPFNNFRIRAQSVRRWKLPDRAEYLWQRTVDRRGPPAGESLIDYQQAMLRMELGSKRISTAFEVPFRATNPDVNRNHAGLGDMQLIVKTVLLDGQQWMLTQYFGTSFSTGSSTMGLGRGRVALEPGLLLRNRWNDRTWIHSEMKFWFPLAGDPQHSGQVVKLATGFNRVFWESDTAAIIPSLEFTNFTVLNGLARNSNGDLLPIDGDTMLYITPGLHYALDRKGDFGLLEVGTGLSQAVTRQHFADSTWTFDLRWSW